MGILLYSEHQRTKNDPISKGKWFSIAAAFGKPINIGFSIHSFGDEAGNLSGEIEREWQATKNIDSFIEYECSGYITHPEPFSAKKIHILVNPLGSANRFKLNDKGVFGEGWYDGERFLVRLYLEHTPARQLLSLMNDPTSLGIAEQNLLKAFQQDVTGHDPTCLNIRFDLIKIFCIEKNLNGHRMR